MNTFLSTTYSFSVITKYSTGHYDGKQFPTGNHRLKDEQVRLTPKTF